MQAVEFRRKRDPIKSPEERDITRRRKNILAKVYRSYTTLKREIYPELQTRFNEIPPPAPIIEGDIIDEPIEDEPIIDQTDSEGPLDSPPHEKRCPIFETPIEANDEIVHDDDNDSIVPYEEDFSMLKLLGPLNEILLDFSGV